MVNNNNTTRFADRVKDYIKYRPGYPVEIIAMLEKAIGFNKSKLVADIGSGTGISSKLFIQNGNPVFGVEPNKEMRQGQEDQLKDVPDFASVDGTAEQTNLASDSIDIIFSGQAFHWFDKEKCKIEFQRILKEEGHIVLVWNQRNTSTAFQKEYEKILYDNIDAYKNVPHRNLKDQDIAAFFSPKVMEKAVILNEQSLDLESLKGRLKSSSYCPKEGAVYLKLMRAIEKLFSSYQDNGQIIFSYETKIYWC